MRTLISFLLVCGIASAKVPGDARSSQVDISGRWMINSELGVVRPWCVTIANNRIVRVGACDNSPGTTVFGVNGPARISENDEVVISYREGSTEADPLFFFDMHRHADESIRGTMIIYRDGAAFMEATFTNIYWEKR